MYSNNESPLVYPFDIYVYNVYTFYQNYSGHLKKLPVLYVYVPSLGLTSSTHVLSDVLSAIMSVAHLTSMVLMYDSRVCVPPSTWSDVL